MDPISVQNRTKNRSKIDPKKVLEATGRGQESARAAFRLLEGYRSALGALLSRKKFVQEGPGRLLKGSQASFHPY